MFVGWWRGAVDKDCAIRTYAWPNAGNGHQFDLKHLWTVTFWGIVTLYSSPPTLSAADRYAMKTADGLTLGFQLNGTIEKLQTGKDNLVTPGSPSGIWVEDAQTGEAEHLLGHVEIRARGVVLTGFAEKLGLKVVAEFIPENTAVRVKGYVENLTERERGVDLQIRVYCDAKGASWARDTQVSTPLGDRRPSPLSIYPFHGLVLPEKRGAFALALSANEPAIFEFGYEQSAFYVLKLRYGLSKFASGRLHKRACFETFIYRIEPEWGFRSVTQKYYQLHEKWFSRRAMKNGLWLFYRPNAEEVPNPWDYAYHADSGEGWKQDRRHGVTNMPYHLPGQREFTQLPEMPQSYADQMEILTEYQQEYTRHISLKSIYETGNLDRHLIVSSGVYDYHQKFRAFTRTTEWGGPSLTFIINPDPDLFYDRPEVTMGKISLEWALWKLDHISEIDGLMIDSLFGWGRYFNCRTDHFPYAQISLSYDPESKLPAISNQFAHQEYLRALREMLLPRDKLLMGNGLRPGRFFNGMELDVLSCENPVRSSKENPIMGADLVGGGESEETGLVSLKFRNPIFDRIVSYKKPYLIVDHHQEDWEDINTVEYFWKIGLFFGVYPGFNWRYQIDHDYYEMHKQIINRYNPMLKQISDAGWEPITYAKSDNPNVWIERYGAIEKGLYFTVMNTTDRELTTVITLLPKPLRLGEKIQCLELVQFDTPLVTENRIQCRLQKEEVKLFKISQ